MIVAVKNGGHYVLVVGKEGDRFQILDPGGSASFLDQYGTQYETRGSVVDPVDLSAISINLSGAARMALTGPEGTWTGILGTVEMEQLPRSGSFIDRLDGDISGERGLEGQLLAALQPSSGSYVLTLTGTEMGVYQLSVRLATPLGDLLDPVAFNGIISAASQRTFELIVQSDHSAVLQHRATFDSLLDDIRIAGTLSLIKNYGLLRAMEAHVENAKRSALAGNIAAALNILTSFQNFIKVLETDSVDSGVREWLLEASSRLRDTLQ